MKTIQNFAEVSSAAVAAAEASFKEILERVRAIDPTAYLDNTIHDEWCIRCAPEKDTEVRAVVHEASREIEEQRVIEHRSQSTSEALVDLPFEKAKTR